MHTRMYVSLACLKLIILPAKEGVLLAVPLFKGSFLFFGAKCF